MERERKKKKTFSYFFTQYIYTYTIFFPSNNINQTKGVKREKPSFLLFVILCKDFFKTNFMDQCMFS